VDLEETLQYLDNSKDPMLDLIPSLPNLIEIKPTLNEQPSGNVFKKLNM